MLKLLVLSSILASCTAGSVKGAECGETFCLPPGATFLQKSQPVEDFNLYRALYVGREYLIYEGNNPADIGSAKTVTLPDNRAVLVNSRANRMYLRLKLDNSKPWPRFLQVSTVAGPRSEQDSIDFVSNFSEKPPGESEK